MQNEQNTVKRLQGGDVTALEEVYKVYSDQIYAFSLSITKTKETAEDIVSEVFMRIYKYLSSGKSVNNLKAFLFTICRNVSYDKLRMLSLNQSLPEEDILFSLEMPIDEKFEVRVALEKLPSDEKDIVVLYCVSGFKHREIAEIMQIPEGTVRWKYRKALEKLKTELGGADFE